MPVSNVSPCPQVSPWNKVEEALTPSTFVGQPVGIDQVGGLWVRDSEAACRMTNNAEFPPPIRSRVTLGDGSAKKVEFIGKIDLIFYSTRYPATLYNVLGKALYRVWN